MADSAFHPAVADWFSEALGEPTEPQRRAWPEIVARRPTLVAAPTGSGKTLAAFLAALDDLFRQGLAGELRDETQVVYVSPLKALSNDIEKNLRQPLAGIAARAAELGLPPVEIRAQVRTGDTPQSERRKMSARPPHVLVTTPESLYILLTSEGGRKLLSTVRTAIVDEIHAVVETKRGSHLALSLERLEALVEANGRPAPQRIGLSATQKPVEEVARFLTGGRDAEVAIVDVGHRRALDLGVELPGSDLEAVMSTEIWAEVYDRVASLAREHRTTLVFVNTRRLSERVAFHLAERLGESMVASHHGSMSRERRLRAEERLKNGELRVLVATASLELGIDIGTIDLVCQIGSVRSISSFLQRVGRSGHHLGGLPKGRLFPLSRDELVEAAALIDAVRRGELETLDIPTAPLDILAQQLVAECAARDASEDEIYALARGAWPYRDLPRSEFDQVVEMLAEGFSTRRGRRAAWLHRDRVHGRLRGRRGARLAAITSGGAIPDQGDFHVLEEPSGVMVGTLNEDFAIESLPGDIFQLGNVSWRIRRIEQGRVLVENAQGAPPGLPFWLGEAPERSAELSASVVRLRERIASDLGLDADPAVVPAPERRGELALRLSGELSLPLAGAQQIVEYMAASFVALRAVPTQETLVVERFFDEAGDQHVVLHAPFGSRMNRAWGLALRKRFCRAFNFELQAAATEDAILLSLGPTHSFPLEDVFRFLHSKSVREVLVQAMLDAPVYGVRWRWNASRALALLRFRGGRRVPPRLLRQEADDLSAVVFPDHLACPENLPGHREVPDHPLVRETVRDCLTEAMDIERLEALLASIERGERRLVAREMTEPSPLAHEVVNARVYAFLDDAPLEERRTQAVQARRSLRPEDAATLGALDPEAIAAVREEAWPDIRDAAELHDALLLFGAITADEMATHGWQEIVAELAAAGRATQRVAASGPALWVAAERLPQLEALAAAAEFTPRLTLPPALRERQWSVEAAVLELLRGRLESSGPTTATALSRTLGVRGAAVDSALVALEAEGYVFRGQFTSEATGLEWCERRLLARIHRRTLDRLRREIEAVSAADFVRFLHGWQRLRPSEHGQGPGGLEGVLEQLAGFEAPAQAWESEILPARLGEYDPVWLDALCLSGRFVWARLSPAESGPRRAGPVKATPIALVPRADLEAWQRFSGRVEPDERLSGEAQQVRAHLADRGASFFAEIARSTRLLATQVEAALGELVAAGQVTADSFTGLRALLVPSNRRPPVHPTGSRRRGGGAVLGMENAGRWSLLPEPVAGDLELEDAAVEVAARALLRRYGVVFRRLLERESLLPPWRELARVYRRLEARGEIRGGRFVDGFSGEQWALPEAVGKLRATRKDEAGKSELVSVAAADPLNLIGIAVPGPRLAALSSNRLLWRGGEPAALKEGAEVTVLPTTTPLAAAESWQLQQALTRRPVPPRLRPYLGRTA